MKSIHLPARIESVIKSTGELRQLSRDLKNNETLTDIEIHMSDTMVLDQENGGVLSEIIGSYAPQNLTGIWLYINKVDSLGVAALAHALSLNKKLKLFAFWNSNINDEQLTTLSEAFRDHQAISHVEVSSLLNQDPQCFGMLGTQSLAQALGHNPHMQRVEITPALHKELEINGDAIARIILANPNINSIMLPCNQRSAAIAKEVNERNNPSKSSQQPQESDQGASAAAISECLSLEEEPQNPNLPITGDVTQSE